MNSNKQKDELSKYIDAIKEKPILKRFPQTAGARRKPIEPTKILYCVTEEVILQGKNYFVKK